MFLDWKWEEKVKAKTWSPGEGMGEEFPLLGGGSLLLLFIH